MIDNHCHLFAVQNFELHKKNLISKIYKIPNNPIKMPPNGNTISHTDWNLPDQMQREYRDYFIKNIFSEFAKNFCNYFKKGNIKLHNLWFQVYKLNDSHESHTHAGCHFTNVFYLKLPNKNLKTQILLPNNKQLEVNVKEGDILTFPAYYWHQSPINTTYDEKIVISFNMDII